MAPRFDAVLLDYGHTLVDLQRPESHLLEAYHQINQRLGRELEREIPEAADLLVAVSEKVDRDIGLSYRTGSEQEVDIADLYRTALRGIDISVALTKWGRRTDTRAAAGPAETPHA